MVTVETSPDLSCYHKFLVRLLFVKAGTRTAHALLGSGQSTIPSLCPHPSLSAHLSCSLGHLLSNRVSRDPTSLSLVHQAAVTQMDMSKQECAGTYNDVVSASRIRTQKKEIKKGRTIVPNNTKCSSAWAQQACRCHVDGLACHAGVSGGWADGNERTRT